MIDFIVYSNSIEFVFPYGATLNAVKPATPVLSTGFTSFPINRPICAFYKHVCHFSLLSSIFLSLFFPNMRQTQAKGGRLAVLSSHQIFDDHWLDKEENNKLQEVILKWLVPHTSFELNPIDAEDPEVSDYHCVPDLEQLADHWKGCLQVLFLFLFLFILSFFSFFSFVLPSFSLLISGCLAHVFINIINNRKRKKCPEIFYHSMTTLYLSLILI